MAAIDRICWHWGPGESRLALMAGDVVVELVLDRPHMLAGSRFIGRVSAVDGALDAAFVDLGTAVPGFLKGAKALGVTQGMAVGVSVRAEAQGTKGPILALDPGLAPDGAIPRLVSRPHVLDRLLAAYPHVTQVVVNDHAALAEARARFAQARLMDAADLVDEAFEAALSPVVDLACGGRLVVEETAALTAIDVDSARAKPADANRDAVAEIARQLRLRGIGGQVVVDFVAGPKGTPYKLAAALTRAVADDPTPTRVAGVSPLGLVELVRKRTGASLAILMGRRGFGPSAETVALSALRRLLAEDRARPGRRLCLVVAPGVAQALAGLDQAVAEAARQLGRVPRIRSDAARAPDDVMIEEDGP